MKARKTDEKFKSSWKIDSKYDSKVLSSNHSLTQRNLKTFRGKNMFQIKKKKPRNGAIIERFYLLLHYIVKKRLEKMLGIGIIGTKPENVL